MSEKLNRARDEIIGHLAVIQRLFTHDAVLTFVMHVPGSPESDMVITAEDDLDQLIGVLMRTKTRQVKDQQ